jgi:hypothetical protein
MARIPNQSLVAPRFNETMLPQGAFGDPTRSMARLAGSVQGVANTIVQMGFEAQDIRNKTQVREKFRELREMQLSFQQEILENNTDPAQWTGLWEQRLKQFENNVSSDKAMPPAVRDTVAEKFTDFAMESSFKIAGESLKENRKRALAVVQADVDDYAKDFNFDGAAAEIEQAFNDKLIDESEREVALKGINRARTEVERDTARTIDPVGYMAELDANKHEMNDYLLQQEKEKTAKEISERERSAVSETKQLIELDILKTPEDVEKHLKGFPEVSDLTRRAMAKQFGKLSSEPLSYKERYDIADKITGDHQAFKKGEITLEEYTKRFNETQTQLEIQGTRSGTGALRERSYRVDPSKFVAPDGTLLSPDEARKKAAKIRDTSQEIGNLIKERVDGKTKVDMIIKFGVSVPESKDGRVVYEKARNAAEEKNLAIRARLEDVVTTWAESLEVPPTYEEARQYLDKIQAEEVFKLFRDGSNTPTRTQVVKDKPTVAPTTGQKQTKQNPAAMTLPELEEYDNWLNEPSVLPNLSR